MEIMKWGFNEGIDSSLIVYKIIALYKIYIKSQNKKIQKIERLEIKIIIAAIQIMWFLNFEIDVLAN